MQSSREKGFFSKKLRKHSRNQNQPQRAHSNFLADYANHRRKKSNKLF
ncbi:hypothetical protein Cabys_3313 [Caldithrix abyssi DSM 13497]|uniref:Uncharacterized protein n=1 Tax=Caldithrix abyssi DSM 13497 TaxID=880073 RepID=A0A1J1CBJ8_CALAY|nr:hypothetical protein Cabys_3313 [Caldithrix abyssi DSM 13497]